jgi:glycosyltransferase involved in cell wall biosynthesis
MAGRVKILRMVTSLRVSGPALQAILLSAKFNDDHHETLLVAGDTHDDADSMMDVARAYGVTPIVIPQIRRSFNVFSQLQGLVTLYRLMKAEKPDVVHTHLTTAGFWGRLVARLAGVPVIVHTLHEHPFKGYYRSAQTAMFVLLERLMARFTHSLITLSERLRRELVESYQITRKSAITVLPLGFDLSPFSAMPRKQGTFRKAWDIPQDAPLVGIIGRLIPVKNHVLFLQAAAQLVQTLPDVRFAIIGDGDLRDDLTAQVRQLHLESHVLFTGWQTDMAHIYSDLDVLALSSLNEGTPVPIIEALAAGCPVVATDVGGVADLLDNGALGSLVPSEDAGALAIALREVLQHPPTMDKARYSMLNRYGIERLVMDLDSLYRGLLVYRRG